MGPFQREPHEDGSVDAIRCKGDLLRLVEARRDLGNLVHFWGHRQPADGVPTETCLSQWYRAPFRVDGIFYATAEHFMMAEKARLFDDAETCGRILACGDPRDAKKWGRRVRGFESDPWNRAKFDVLVRGNVAKFSQNPPLRSFLLGTGSSVLVEASPTDLVYGIGLRASDPRAGDPGEWPGENLLGFALMEVRSRLRVQR